MSDSIRDSIAGAMEAVEEVDQFLAVELPKPISVDNVDPEKAAELAEKEKKKTEPEKRRDALRRAAKKADELQAARAKPKKADKDEPVVSGEEHVNRQLLRGIISKRMDAPDERADPKALNAKDVREHRQMLRHYFPGMSLTKIIEQAEHWDGELKRDPVAGREELMKVFLKVGPQNFGKFTPKEYADGLRGSLERAQENQKDLDELESFNDKYGRHAPHVLRQVAEFIRDGIEDPAGVTARLAAAAGAPATELEAQRYVEQRQQQEQSKPKPVHERTPQEDQANVLQAVELIAKQHDHPSVNLPGLNKPEMMHAVADVLESGLIPRTNDRMADLRAAHAMVMQMQGKETAEHEKRMERGGKSVSGSPSNGGGPARSRGGSISQALNRAAGSM